MWPHDVNYWVSGVAMGGAADHVHRASQSEHLNQYGWYVVHDDYFNTV